MELTMKRERVECCEKVFEYCAPAEEAAETVIPDTMPDVERVLCAGGTAIIRSKEVQEGRVSLTAGVAATVIYTPEGEDGMEFIRRVIKGLNDVFQDMMANDVHNAALVIPGGMIMSMLALMGFPRHPMGEWECAAGAGYTIVMTPELWTRDKVFEVLSSIPMKPEDWEDHWSTKKYYEDGEEMFFE